MNDEPEHQAPPSWRRALPPGRGWLGLLCAPGAYTLIICLVATCVAKALVTRDLDASSGPLTWAWAISVDLMFFGCAAALFALGEGLRRWLGWVVAVLTSIVAVLALINVWYLIEAGEQMTWSTLTTGVDRFDDLWNIIREKLGLVIVAFAVAGAVAVAIPAVVFRIRLRHHSSFRGLFRPPHTSDRAHAAAALALIGALLWLILPRPEEIPAQRLGQNAVVGTYLGYGKSTPLIGDEPTPGTFAGYVPPFLVSQESVARFASKTEKPNVVIIVLESTRFDHTSLAKAYPEWRGTETPAIEKLAKSGTSFSHTRAVVPHTSKSLFTVLCGRYPTLQRWIIETATNVPVQCLPSVLRAAGYRTAFFQSALGMFEARPRLVRKFGFGEFFAHEEIGGQPVGYLASDDRSLAPAVTKWVNQAEGPYMVTVLTSATHHPYRLTRAQRQRATEMGWPLDTEEQLYAALVDAEDQMVQDILSGIGFDAGNTLVVVVGDHGEGFGKKGVRQHDNNFFEEGLRVPFVIAGPGVPPNVVDHNVSLIDVTPTLLGRLGMDIAPEARDNVAGIDLLAGPVPEDRPLPFVCWYDGRCRGFVRGTDKVVIIPELEKAVYLDLATDPQENRPKGLPKRLKALTDEVSRLIDSYRTEKLRPLFGEVRYGEWHCPKGRMQCKHPRGQGLRPDQPPRPAVENSSPAPSIKAPSK